MALSATPEQLERLIEAGQSLECHARERADELVDEDCGSVWPIYTEEVAKIEGDIDRFNAIRRELEGVQSPLTLELNA